MTGFRRILARTALLLVSLGASRGVAAQGAVSIAGGAELSTMQMSRDAAAGSVHSGPVFGASGRLQYRRFILDAWYAQGTLAPDAATLGDDEDIAEGAFLLRAAVLPWLSVGAGPRLRAFITPAGTSHWTRVELHARVDRDVVAGFAQADLGLWYAPVATATAQGGGSGAVGGEAGLTLQAPRSPLAFRLSYSADHATFASGNAEFVESVSLAFVFRRRP